MKHTSPLSAGRATSRTTKAFSRATLALTAWYAVGVLVLLVIFNVLIYFLFTQKIHIEPEHGGDALVIENEADGGDGDDDTPVVADNTQTTVDDDLLVAQGLASAAIMLLVIVLAYALSRTTLRPIEVSYERQQRFVADAAHELRTPLAVMRAGAEVALAHEQSASGYRIFIADMLDESKRLSKLSDDLLVLARGGSAVASHESIELNELTHTMCDLVRPYATQKELTLLCKAGTTPITIDGIVSDIRRVFMNVLTNAVDYTEQGSVIATVITEGKRAIIRVTDTGIGIPPEDVSHVFERFYKADASRTVRESGAGLGLAIVKEIVERHGGTVGIESQIGHGTTVILSFPIVS